MVAILLMICLITNLPNFVFLLADPGFFYPLPLNFYEKSRLVPHWMDAPDGHNEKTDRDKRTIGQTDASLSVCLLGGV